MNGKTLSANLRGNAVFQLSLSSKELFHSNFLDWLANDPNTRSLFNKILRDTFGADFDFNPERHVTYREKDNFDFCICERNTIHNQNGDKVEIEGAILFVLENKFKSIPYKKQLNDYKTKVEKWNLDKSKKYKAEELHKLKQEEKKAEENYKEFIKNHHNCSKKCSGEYNAYQMCKKVRDDAHKTYSEKSKETIKPKTPFFCLLSLVDDFAGRDDVITSDSNNATNEKVWKMVTYQDYAKALRDKLCKNYNDKTTEFFYQLIANYANFVSLIAESAQGIASCTGGDKVWLAAFKNEEWAAVRLNDIWQKLVASKLCAMIATKYGYTFAYDDKEVADKAVVDKIGTVYTDAGFSNGTGIVNVRLKISETCFFMIQIQGEQYRRVLWAAKDSAGSNLQAYLETDKNMSNIRLTNTQQQSKPCHLEDILLGDWECKDSPLGLFQPLAGKLFRYHDVPEDFMLPIFLPKTVDATSVNADDTICPKLKDPNQDRGFNKFDSNFVYQYYKIDKDKDVTIDQVFAVIDKDIDTVKQELQIP